MTSASGAESAQASNGIPFVREGTPPVRGYLHEATTPGALPGAIVLAHGAGSNCQAPLLVALAEEFARSGITVLRCDLPYRQKRRYGPPFPGEAQQDREGLQKAVEAVRGQGSFPRIFLGGHSYGGRQATMLAAEDRALAGGLLLMSYPLHPPNQPARLRTGHFGSIPCDALFFSGTRDPFGSVEELETALRVIPARTLLVRVEGAGHDLGWSRAAKAQRAAGGRADPQSVVASFLRFFGPSAAS